MKNYFKVVKDYEGFKTDYIWSTDEINDYIESLIDYDNMEWSIELLDLIVSYPENDHINIKQNICGKFKGITVFYNSEYEKDIILNLIKNEIKNLIELKEDF